MTYKTGKKSRLTKVVFRYWQNDVIALFPEIAWDGDGLFCTSYMTVGQHSDADYKGVIEHSRPATPDEYKKLAIELERKGYVLDIRKRRPPAMRVNKGTV